MDHWIILILALLIDLSVGDPAILYRVIPHPVVALGYFIDWGERRSNTGSARRRQIHGAGLTLVVTVIAALFGYLCNWLALQAPVSGLWQALLASTLFAGRSLYEHVDRVASGLQYSLAAGRAAVAHIVGRDPRQLDRAGVARAAIESAAENFADGVVAPVFWFALLGLPGLCAYKAINTLDSMIGYRNERFEHFGKTAARLDDLVNWLPARISGLLFISASTLVPSAQARRAWQILCRDAARHRSPNAGWPESAVAGALNIRLAGPRCYPDHQVNDPWIGNGRQQLTHRDIRTMLQLYRMASLVMILIIAAIAGIDQWFA